MQTLHAPSRRELLLASGVLFAWAHLPQRHAPKAVTRASWSSFCAARSTVLPRSRRSATRTRWRCAATRFCALDGPTPGAAARRFFALNPAMPNLHRLYRAGRGQHRACGRHALPGAFAFRRPGCARERPARRRAPPTSAGSIARLPRSNPARGSSPARRAKPSRSVRSRRWWCAAGRRCCHGRRRAWSPRPTIP